jgi:type IV secretory pathway TraG/TraD family ATPase VirD4
MPSQNSKLWRAGLLLTTSLVAPALVAGAILCLPKDPTFAATSRLVLAMDLFAVASIGVVGFSAALRRFRDLALLWRYGGASSAVRDSLSYLKEERRLATRGQVPALTAAIGLAGLAVLARWPQAAALAPYASAFGWASVAALLCVPAAALKNRTHYINTFFLKRYIRAQCEHLGYRPRRWRERKRNIAFRITGIGRFRAGGFEWHFDDFVKGGIVFGQTGSGKTVAVLNSMLAGLVGSFASSDLKLGGLIIDAKGDFLKKIQNVCAKYGREDSLYVLDPDAWRHSARTPRAIAWNPLHNNDDPLEIATRLVAALKLIGLQLGNEGSYFLDSAKIFLRHGITLLRAAYDIPSMADLYKLSQEPETKPEFYHQMIARIGARHVTAPQREVMESIAYMENIWAKVADREKSAIRGTLAQLLDEFMVSPFQEMLSGASTLSIDEMVDQGVILYVHMPLAQRERMSQLVNTMIKLEYQKAVLKRPKKASPTFFLCDEFQSYFVTGEGRGDSDFFERSRESFHANLVSTQNMSAFLKRSRNSADIRNFMGNIAVKISLRNTEEETLRWASALFGARSEIVVSSSEQAAIDGHWSRRRHTSYSRSTRSLPRVPSEEFTNLPIPVKGTSQQTAGSIIHLGSRPEVEHLHLEWPVHPLE